MPRWPSRRVVPGPGGRSQGWRSASLLAVASALALHFAPAFLGQPSRPADAPVEGGGRRSVLQGGLVGAVGVSAGLSMPEDALAFRGDRIQNSKKRYTPKIRAYYQKLEGLRDDLYLQVELKKGDANSRVQFPARPADWYGGADSKLDGEFVLAGGSDGFGCEEYTLEKPGAVVLVPRGRCTFADKVEFAMKAGAKSVIVYDAKVSKMPLETQGKMGTTRSKGIATRDAGDALSGGASILPKEMGVTVMAYPKNSGKPSGEGVMISLSNGTSIIDAIKDGSGPRVLDVKRFDFTDNIDQFCKKDLKKMINEMEIYSNTMRVSKDDMSDPILTTLKNDRDAFAAAVKAKDYTKFRAAFKKWNEDLDPLGQWSLTEEF